MSKNKQNNSRETRTTRTTRNGNSGFMSSQVSEANKSLHCFSNVSSPSNPRKINFGQKNNSISKQSGVGDSLSIPSYLVNQDFQKKVQVAVKASEAAKSQQKQKASYKNLAKPTSLYSRGPCDNNESACPIVRPMTNIVP